LPSGFVGWRVLDAKLRELTAGGKQAEYPIFKMRRQLVPGR